MLITLVRKAIMGEIFVIIISTLHSGTFIVNTFNNYDLARVHAESLVQHYCKEDLLCIMHMTLRSTLIVWESYGVISTM